MPEPIPAFPLPLKETEPEPIINLQNLLGDIYDQSGYDLVINYNDPPVPALKEADSVWLAEWLTKIRDESER